MNVDFPIRRPMTATNSRDSIDTDTPRNAWTV